MSAVTIITRELSYSHAVIAAASVKNLHSAQTYIDVWKENGGDKNMLFRLMKDLSDMVDIEKHGREQAKIILALLDVYGF